MATHPSQPMPDDKPTMNETPTDGAATNAAPEASATVNEMPTSVSTRTEEIVERSMANEPEAVKQETMQLVEALTTRAQSELQGAQQVSLDMYLGAVRNATEMLQENRVFDPQKIERSLSMIQADAQKNMESVLDDIKKFGERLGDRVDAAAKAAWETFNRPQ